MATIRGKFIEKINEDFELLSTIVLRQTEHVLHLMDDNRDEQRYKDINENEKLIDGLEVKIRDEVINSIVLYNPRASDSRKIISYHDMVVNFQGALYPSFQRILREQVETVKEMTQNAIFAFTYEDEDLAKSIIHGDDLVDQRHLEIIHGLPSLFVGKEVSEQDMLDALSLSNMSYNIERIGDNATNIAESAIYLMEGKNAKHIFHEANQ